MFEKSHGGTLSFTMQVTFKLPDEIAEGLGGDAEIPRRVLEALILQRYMSEEISLARLAELLDLSRTEAESFLDHNNARLPYTREMLDEDRRNLAEAFGAR
jgi:predicted HTH domain antitoxin